MACYSILAEGRDCSLSITELKTLNKLYIATLSICSLLLVPTRSVILNIIKVKIPDLKGLRKANNII